MSNGEQPEEGQPVEIHIAQEMVGGVWANWASVAHSPYEFTIDFVRLDFTQQQRRGVVVARVNLSPLFVRELMDALEGNWTKYARKAMPREVHDDGQDQ